MKITKKNIMDAIDMVAKLNRSNGYKEEEAIARAAIEVENLIQSITKGKLSILDIIK
jgi:aspartate ammonia-lyase